MKVSLIPWRLNSMLPKRDNIACRGTFEKNLLVFSRDYGSEENYKQIFFEFNSFKDMWSSILKWLDESCILHNVCAITHTYYVGITIS